VTETFKLPV